MTQENTNQRSAMSSEEELQHRLKLLEELMTKSESTILRLRATTEVNIQELSTLTSKYLDLRVEYKLLSDQLTNTQRLLQDSRDALAHSQSVQTNLEAELVKRSTQLIRSSKRNQESLELFSKCAVQFAAYMAGLSASSYGISAPVTEVLNKSGFPRPTTVKRILSDSVLDDEAVYNSVKSVYAYLNKPVPTFKQTDMPLDYYLNAFYQLVAPVNQENSEAESNS